MKKTTLLSFHGKQEIKDQYLTRLKLHADADEIVKGIYWEKGKGCAVGCTIHSNEHKAYETELGIPMILARLEDKFFEGMSNKDAKQFPVRFLNAIPVGVDLSNVWCKFMAWMLTDKDHGVIKFVKDEATRLIITKISDAFLTSIDKKIPVTEWETLRNEARSASRKLYDAAAYAAAAYAAAAYATTTAADAYAATTYAAYAATAYATTTTAADAYAAVDDASKKTKETTFLLYANKLIELLKEAK